MIKVTRKVHFTRRPNRSRALIVEDGWPAAPVAPGRVPRIARLMALAIHFDRLIQEGKLLDQSELARLAHVTQPRMTQIMNLNHLAPDIQEELLHLPLVTRGRESIHEKSLRHITAELSWDRQRAKWVKLKRMARR